MNSNKERARRDLLIICLIALAFAILELYVDSFERLIIWASEQESLLMTEFVTITIVFSIGFAIYSWRRWQELATLEAKQIQLQKTVSEEQNAKALSRSYTEAITRGQEAERRRLARELHDDTIHQLILLNQKVGLAAFDHADSSAASDLVEMQSLIDETIDHLRGFIQELRPTYLDELGLVTALNTLIRKTRERTDLLIEFELIGEPCRLGESIELTLYRIVQSALTNVVLHADASMASVVLNIQPKQIELTIQDDGCGFDHKNERYWVSQGHFGLVGIRERAEMFGANYQINSIPDQGTTIHVSIPRGEKSHSLPQGNVLSGI